jgi:hypothetical protein
MLSDETPQRPPPKVRRHLQHCPRCRKRYARVVRLIHEIEQQPLPDTRAAQARFLESLPPRPALETQAGPVLIAPPRRVPRRSWTRWLQAAMLLIGFGLGWAALPLLRQAPKPESNKPVVRSPRPKEQRQLEDRILEQHLQLAEAQKPAEQVQALGKMATDLKTESLRQARKGEEAADDLAYLVWLYRRVIGEGVVRSAAVLPAAERGVLKPVIADLEETRTEAAQLGRAATPGVAGPLKLLVKTAALAAKALKKPEEVALLDPVSDKPPVEESGSRSLLKVMVVQSLLVVAEDDPVRRADHSTRVAHSLAQAIIDRAATADEEEAKQLGQSLEAVVDRAVNPNLELVAPKVANPAKQKEAEEVRKRARKAVAVVKEKLPDMPEQARDALKRVFENKRRNWSPPRPKPSGGFKHGPSKRHGRHR